MALSKADQKQLDRASAQGRGALLRAMAIIHRSGSARTQKEIVRRLMEGDALGEFQLQNGGLVHYSEANYVD